jgi:hypothetical protein
MSFYILEQLLFKLCDEIPAMVLISLSHRPLAIQMVFPQDLELFKAAFFQPKPCPSEGQAVLFHVA